jgi:putative nucleotidyltransferase with HDIG domain
MDVQCEVCKTIFKIQDGLLPAGKRIRFACKRCRSAGGSVGEDRFSKTATLHAIGHPRPQPHHPDPKGNRLTKERILNRIGELPAMPQVITEIQNQMTDAEVNTRKICHLIESDPAVAAEILRFANSAFFGRSGKISTTQGALNIIGLKGLMEVVSLIGARKIMLGKPAGYGFGAEELWKHSLAVASGSKLLALEKDPGISHTAHLAGLIHDVGRIILDRFMVEKKAEISAFMVNGHKTFIEAEAEFFGLTHAEAAAEACRKWNFPEIITNAIGWHHEPSKSGNDLLAHILSMADQLATMSGIGDGRDELRGEADAGTMDFLGLKQADLDSLILRITESVDQATKL